MSIGIKCIACGKVIEVSKDKIEAIDKFFLGDESPRPADYLELFTLVGGYCEKKKGKHTFIYDEAFLRATKEIVVQYSVTKEKLDNVNKEITDIENKVGELIKQREELNKKWEEINKQIDDLNFKNTVLDTFAIQAEVDNVLDKLEKLVGTRNIELWR